MTDARIGLWRSRKPLEGLRRLWRVNGAQLVLMVHALALVTLAVFAAFSFVHFVPHDRPLQALSAATIGYFGWRLLALVVEVGRK